LGYINVAFTEPILFKSIYVDNILNIKLTDILPNAAVIEVMSKELGISENRLQELASKSWIFAHGLASLVATEMIEYDEKKIEQLLSSFFEEISKK